jgi:hypothetical protein
MENRGDKRPDERVLSDGGLVERQREPSVDYRRDTASHERPGIERHHLPGTIPVGDYHEYYHADRWAADDAPLNGSGPLEWLATDERLVYDVVVREPGPYDLSLHVSAPEGFDGGIVGIVVDSDPVCRVYFRPTGGWETFDHVDTQVELPAGLHTIQLVVYDGDWKLDRIEFR